MSREMRDSGIEWIGTIPENWTLCRIKNIAKLYTGNSIKDDEKANYEDKIDAVPYVSTKDIDATFQKINYDNGMYIKKNDINFKRAPCESTLLCIEGGSAGKKIAYTNQEVCFVNKLCCLNSDVVLNRYLHYYLMSPSFIEEFNLHISGLIGGVSVNELKNITFIQPPLIEQQNILSLLDKNCIEIDLLVEKTKQTIEEYKKLKQSIITEAVTKGIRKDRPMKDSGIEWIGEIPEDWECVKIKWLLNERSDRSNTGDEESLSMSQKYGLIPTKDMDLIPNMTSSNIGSKIVFVGDLVFNKLKAHLGVFAVSKYHGITSPDYAVYHSTKLVDVKYLEYLFKTSQYIAEFKKRSTGVGAGLTRLYTKDLFSMYCSCPSMDEQIEIIDYLNQKSSEVDHLTTYKEKLLFELESYKKSLIYEYVTGKKEVVDAIY